MPLINGGDEWVMSVEAAVVPGHGEVRPFPLAPLFPGPGPACLPLLAVALVLRANAGSGQDVQCCVCGLRLYMLWVAGARDGGGGGG
jgi:hypothetical protein